MNKKIIILLGVIGVCLFLSSPVFAKDDVKVDISVDEGYNINGGYIEIKLIDNHGNPIKSKGTIHYNITDEFGNYKWAYKSYGKLLRLKYSPGKYNVKVKFDGDSKYDSAEGSKNVRIHNSRDSFDPYTYYDNHNWGLNQKVDDYIEDNYWDEEIYDDPFTYDGEGP